MSILYNTIPPVRATGSSQSSGFDVIRDNALFAQ